MNSLEVAMSSDVFYVNGREYELFCFHEEEERSVSGDEMVRRGNKNNADLAEEDGRIFLEHQGEIPREIRRRFRLIFLDWRNPLNLREVACVGWDGYQWCQRWVCLDARMSAYVRLVRRIE